MLSTVNHSHQRILLLNRRRPPPHLFSPKSSLSTTQPPPSTPAPSQILSIRHTLLNRQLTAVDVAESYLTRLRLAEPTLRSFLHVADEDSVLKAAADVDRRIQRGEEVGPLAGVLVGVKDNICTADMDTTAGSRVLEGYRPPFDATAVRKVKELGAILVGKTNLDEFGMGSTTESSAFQVTANPWDESCVPGGSSGGSAAAVSARQCVVSLGSDTGGSVRQPASFCGVVGLKPTYGRVSRYGLVAYASSLDVIGCFGTSVADAGILLHAISGHDRFDATSSKQEVPEFASQFISSNFLESKPLQGVRVGVIRETLEDGVDETVVSSIREAASHLENLGCSVTEVSLPSFSLGLPAYYVLASSESSSNLSRYDGVRYGTQVAGEELASLYGDSRAKGFGAEVWCRNYSGLSGCQIPLRWVVKRRILMGTYALSAGYYDAYYKRAQQVRTLVKKSFRAALDENDILISPAAPSAAYKIGMAYSISVHCLALGNALLTFMIRELHLTFSGEKKNNPLAMYAGDIMTEKLLRIGHIFEQTLEGHSFVPPIVNTMS
ncbi:hypothetical protein KSS87_019962 [Heliosperma pusillum]|nr:hypothetical protein KSS87_019962 [Heliosperma pusillum]